MGDDDREAILRRRAAFIAAALAGLVATNARAQDGGAAGEGAESIRRVRARAYR